MGNFFEPNDGEVCLGFFYMGHYDGENPRTEPKPDCGQGGLDGVANLKTGTASLGMPKPSK